MLLRSQVQRPITWQMTSVKHSVIHCTLKLLGNAVDTVDIYLLPVESFRTDRPIECQHPRPEHG